MTSIQQGLIPSPRSISLRKLSLRDLGIVIKHISDYNASIVGLSLQVTKDGKVDIIAFATSTHVFQGSIVEHQCKDSKQKMVLRFFSPFRNYEDHCGLNWKLKDWLPSTDFKMTFSELYNDFVWVTPVPNYVWHDSVLNIVSHYPSKAVGPDLGPKMYNALASFESKGSKGSMRMHMNMADAVNIMTYASLKPDGSPRYAAWDIYKVGDVSAAS